MPYSHKIHKSLIWLAASVFIGNHLNAQDSTGLFRYRSMIVSGPDTTRVNGFRGMGNVYQGVLPDSAIYFAKQGLALAEKINWTKGIAQCSLNLGALFSMIGVYDSAAYYATKALAPAKIIGDKSRLALIYVNRGSAYADAGQYELAMDDNRQAVQLAEESGNKDRQARAAQNMTEIYMQQENYIAALPWANKAYSLNKETGDNGMLSVAEMSLGGLYAKLKEFSKAQDYLRSAFRNAKENDRPDITVEASLSLAEVYNQTNQPGEAVKMLQKALPVAKEWQLKDREAALYEAIASSYLQLGSFTDALTAGRMGYQLVMGNDSFQKRQYENLYDVAKAYRGLHLFREAFDTAFLADQIRDRVMKEEQSTRLIRFQTQFETEQKEKQIALLQKQQQLNIANERRQQTFRIAAYIVVALLILIALLVINRFRILNRTRRIRDMEAVRNSIARDLHDDIGSTLTSINVLSTVALKQPSGADLNGNIEKIRQRSAGIMERMNDIVWAINPVNDALDRLIERMRTFLQEMCEQAGIEHSFNTAGNLVSSTLSLAERNQLYLVFKEAVNNAVKYSAASLVTVTLERTNKGIELGIRDNGQGFDEETVAAGNGLANMRSRAAELGGSIKIGSGPGAGTFIQLFIPGLQ